MGNSRDPRRPFRPRLSGDRPQSVEYGVTTCPWLAFFFGGDESCCALEEAAFLNLAMRLDLILLRLVVQLHQSLPAARAERVLAVVVLCKYTIN